MGAAPGDVSAASAAAVDGEGAAERARGECRAWCAEMSLGRRRAREQAGSRAVRGWQRLRAVVEVDPGNRFLVAGETEGVAQLTKARFQMLPERHQRHLRIQVEEGEDTGHH